MRRVQIAVHGIVQGVGFRPFVHATATRCGLSGWVRNRPGGVAIEAQGPPAAIAEFLVSLRRDAPPAARIESIESGDIEPGGEHGFAIEESETAAAIEPSLPADLALCAACAEEIATPAARRAGYAFTNCTACGPRYTIIESLPYDRQRTSMRRFRMCARCASEYADPTDRRFHAQPIACPVCGPSLRLLDADGGGTACGAAALDGAIEAIAAGRVLAVKGVGGFHLLVDACRAEAVQLLRARKGREEKPLAVMFPSLEAVRHHCEVSSTEAAELRSSAAPIVLLDRCHGSAVSEAVAPGNPRIGALLPYSPLHALLLAAVDRPLVCTSGNRSEEPICVDEEEACRRLAGIADRFLVHDRPIVRPVDDSVVQVSGGRVQTLRRSRGYVPTAIRVRPGVAARRRSYVGGGTPPRLHRDMGRSVAVPRQSDQVVALGGHLKNTIAVGFDGQIVLSQHLGDLSSPEAVELQERTVADLVRFFDLRPGAVACDLHPDYPSTRLARRLASTWNARLELVQHHHAHAAACAAEHGVSNAALALVWDGAGLGTDGLLWGGEAIWLERAAWRRIAHLRPFPLPGGEAAMREPRRAALGLLHARGRSSEDLPSDAFTVAEASGLGAMLVRGLRCPLTTSIGRLFDAVASLLGLRQRTTFEGQAAMELEWAASRSADGLEPYPFPLGDGEPAVADWEPCVRGLLEDRRRGVPPEEIAARFHAGLAALAVEIAERAGVRRVALSGGCFQNQLLADLVVQGLRERGFEALVSCRVPPNDGGLALGQAAVALWRGETGKREQGRGKSEVGASFSLRR